MAISRLTAEEFARAFASARKHVYNTIEFIELNHGRCDEIFYLADNGIGIVLGLRENKLLSPFSAPFGGFIAERDLPQYDAVDGFVYQLSEFGRAQGRDIYVTLPPSFYYPALIGAADEALMRHGQLLYTDLNHHFDLAGYDDPAVPMHRSARSHYRKSLGLAYIFDRFETPTSQDIERAYAVILGNRQRRGYPLRMTLDAVKATAPIVNAKFGVLALDGQDVAAVQIHRVTDNVAQIVYWGDIPFQPYKAEPMARLVPEVFTWCRDLGFRIVDIGPSSSCGEVSSGLSEFKESHGCVGTPKHTYILYAHES